MLWPDKMIRTNVAPYEPYDWVPAVAVVVVVAVAVIMMQYATWDN